MNKNRRSLFLDHYITKAYLSLDFEGNSADDNTMKVLYGSENNSTISGKNIHTSETICTISGK